jgi:hypothetical protein
MYSGRVRLSPASTRNTDEPRNGSFMIRIPDPSLEAATWKTGLKGGFGRIATIDLFFLVLPKRLKALLEIKSYHIPV